jgi:hypothetical protein
LTQAEDPYAVCPQLSLDSNRLAGRSEAAFTAPL